MTTFSKVLAVFTTVACFAFLGFVLVSLIAGPNWVGETYQFEDYVFERSEGENPQWSAKNRLTDQAVGSPSPVLPKKIVDVLTQIKQEQQARLNILEQGDPQVQPPPQGITAVDAYLNDPNTGVKALMSQDITALNEYKAKLQTDLSTVLQATEKTTREVSDKITQIEAIYLQAERRRGDIYRLQNLVAEAETDRYRSIEHQKKLRDVWERYQGVIKRLEQRQQGLTAQLKTLNEAPAYEEAAKN